MLALLTLINLFLPHWKFVFVKCLLQELRRLSSKAGAAQWEGSGCPASSPGPGMNSCSGDSACAGDKSHSHILGHSQPEVPAQRQSCLGSQGWRGYRQWAGVGWSGGRGSGMTGDIFGVGEHKWLKPALSACYKLAISRAEIWQSVNTGSKTTWRKNVPGIHLRRPLEGRKTSLKENKCFTVVFQTSSVEPGCVGTLFLYVWELFVCLEPVVTCHLLVLARVDAPPACTEHFWPLWAPWCLQPSTTAPAFPGTAQEHTLTKRQLWLSPVYSLPIMNAAAESL